MFLYGIEYEEKMPPKPEGAPQNQPDVIQPGSLKEALSVLAFTSTHNKCAAPQNAVNAINEVGSHAVSAIEKLGSVRRSFKPIQSTADAGAMVRDARKRMNYSQQRLADLAGVGRRFISELESGKPTLEFNRVAKVCAACGIDLFGSLRSERQ